MESQHATTEPEPEQDEVEPWGEGREEATMARESRLRMLVNCIFLVLVVMMVMVMGELRSFEVLKFWSVRLWRDCLFDCWRCCLMVMMGTDHGGGQLSYRFLARSFDSVMSKE